MIESFMTIYVGDNVSKRINSLTFGYKKEKYLQQMAANTQIERLSDNILYAGNFDGVVTIGKKHYIKDLQEIRQLLEPIQMALKQPILSSALIWAPQPINSREPGQILKDITPLKDIPEIVDDDWVPVLFEEEGKYYVGWQPPAYLSQQLKCNYLPQWQANHNKLPGQNIVTIAKLLSRKTSPFHYDTVALSKDVTLEMVTIPGGTFMMGSPKTEKGRKNNEGPQHKVTIESFSMSKYLVTQAQWEAVMKKNPSHFKGDERPVENISWKEALKFCKQLSKETDKRYRLPSEAEWEYACRAGTTTAFEFGKTISSNLGNYGHNETKTTGVGHFPPNAFGLYDMHGNVWEWCADPWHNNYEDAPTDGRVWEEGEEESYRVLRGGSWSNVPQDIRAARRQWSNMDKRYGTLGFRVVVDRATWY
ncbi:MAG: formylglycine-generating enzyme family protein [Pseudomonadota bacterium]